MRLRRRWRWILGATLSLLAGAAVTVWLTFQHIPSWYRPVKLPPEEFNRIRADFTNAGNSFTNALGGRSPDDDSLEVAAEPPTPRPFQYRLTQEQLNAWLAYPEQIWPLSRNWLGKTVSDPLVLIGEDCVRVAATCRISGVQTVLSTRFEITADQDRLHVRLLGADAGSLPVPDYLIRRQLARLDELGWPTGERIRGRDDDTPPLLLSHLPDGADFQNTWTWKMASRPFRIIRLQLENGAVELTIEPLPRQRSRH